jgi:allantoin racemase
MKLLVVNCNTSEDMTDAIAAAARSAARPGTEIVAVTPSWGVASAEGFFDSYISAASVLDVLMTTEAGYDAVIMAGFGEHGREGARQLLEEPVVDITEAAVMFACLLGQRFGVVTTTATTVQQIRHSLLTMGLLERCVGVRASELRVLGLHADLDATVARFVAESRRLIDEGAEVIVLGCAGMADLQERVSAELDVPVIDGVSAAVAMCESMVSQRMRTSKVGSYASPDLTKIVPRPVTSPVISQGAANLVGASARPQA